MKLLGVLALLTSSLAAGELVEVAEVVKEAVPGSREVTYVYRDQSEVLHLQGALIATEDFAKVSPGPEPGSVTFELTSEGAKKFSEKTAGMVGKRIAILAQGKVISAPGIRSALGGNFTLTGFKDEAEVKAFVDAFGKREK